MTLNSLYCIHACMCVCGGVGFINGFGVIKYCRSDELPYLCCDTYEVCTKSSCTEFYSADMAVNLYSGAMSWRKHHVSLVKVWLWSSEISAFCVCFY